MPECQSLVDFKTRAMHSAIKNQATPFFHHADKKVHSVLFLMTTILLLKREKSIFTPHCYLLLSHATSHDLLYMGVTTDETGINFYRAPISPVGSVGATGRMIEAYVLYALNCMLEMKEHRRAARPTYQTLR